MKLIQLSFLFLATFLFCSWDSLQIDPVVEDGKEIYLTYCKSCHGKKGNLGLGGAAKLNKSEMSYEDRVEVIANGKGKMAPFGSILSEKEVEAVAKYTETFSK